VGRVAFALLLLAALGAARLGAEPQPLPPPGSLALPAPPADPFAAAAPPPGFDALVLLPNESVPVFYPPGALDRAARVQQRLVALRRHWQRISTRPLAWKALVLRRDDWERAGLGAAYGAPRRLAPGLFAIPAAGDAGTVALARSLVGGQLPDPGVDPFVGTREETASLVVSDLLLQLEAARELVAAAPLAGEEPWVGAILGQLAVRLGWERIERGMTLPYVALFDAIAGAQGGPRARRLADYRGELSFEAELWYQAQFVRGADAIWVGAGELGAARLLRKAARAAAPIAAAELEENYPALGDWRRAAFAP
jgi:hypothetical protein